jgi:hypothetical protein
MYIRIYNIYIYTYIRTHTRNAINVYIQKRAMRWLPTVWRAIHIHIHIYIYIVRERERERESVQGGDSQLYDALYIYILNPMCVCVSECRQSVQGGDSQLYDALWGVWDHFGYTGPLAHRRRHWPGVCVCVCARARVYVCVCVRAWASLQAPTYFFPLFSSP